MGQIPEYRRRIFASSAIGTPNINVGGVSAAAGAAQEGAENIGAILRQSGAVARQDTAQVAGEMNQTAAALSHTALTAAQLALSLADQKKKKMVDKAAITRMGTEYEAALDSQLTELGKTTEARKNPRILPERLATMSGSLRKGIAKGMDPDVFQEFDETAAVLERKYQDKARSLVDKYELENVTQDFELTKQAGVTRGASAGSLPDLMQAMQEVDARLIEGFTGSLGTQAEIGSRATRGAMMDAYVQASFQTRDAATVLDEFQTLKKGILTAKEGDVLHQLFDEGKLSEMEKSIGTQVLAKQKQDDDLALIRNSNLLDEAHANLSNGDKSPLAVASYARYLEDYVARLKGNPKADPKMVAVLETQALNFRQLQKQILRRGGPAVIAERSDMGLKVAEAAADLFSKLDKKTGKRTRRYTHEEASLDTLKRSAEFQHQVLLASEIGAITSEQARGYLSLASGADAELGKKIEPVKGSKTTLGYDSIWDAGLANLYEVADQLDGDPELWGATKEEIGARATLVPTFFKAMSDAVKSAGEMGREVSPAEIQQIAGRVVQAQYVKQTGRKMPVVGETAFYRPLGRYVKVKSVTALGLPGDPELTDYEKELLNQLQIQGLA